MSVDFSQLHRDATMLLAQGLPERALEIYRKLLAKTNAADADYAAWVEGAARAFHALGRDREAGLAYLLLGRLDRAQELLSSKRYPVEAALVLEAQARSLLTRAPERAAGLLTQAAEIYAGVGLRVSSAIAWSKAGDARRAAGLWQEVLGDERLRRRSYEEALVHFNLWRSLRHAGEGEASREHFDAVRRLLQEMADEFATRQESDREFECYLVFIQLGKELHDFSLLIEGYLNSIRITSEDNLKFYALQYYEDLLSVCQEHQEHQAAALVAHQAADFAGRSGLVYDRAYLKRAAASWCQAAEQMQEEGAPAVLAEQAYLAAVQCLRPLRDEGREREVHRKLSDLGLPVDRYQRYLALADQRPSGSAPGEAPEFPQYLRHSNAYPDIWIIDLVEWECDGDPLAVCRAVLADAAHVDMVRRVAWVAVLECLEEQVAEGGDGGGHRKERLAALLGRMQTYSSLRPLEKLYEERDQRLRRTVIEALNYLTFSRTFSIIRRALADPDPAIRSQALQTLPELHFPHAVRPLWRIFRDFADPEIKRAAIEALGRSGELSAGEILIEILIEERGSLQHVAYEQLRMFNNPDVMPRLRRAFDQTTGSTRDLIETVIHRRG